MCLERALANSGLSPSDVNYVNAHATSTQVGTRKTGGARNGEHGKGSTETLVPARGERVG